jgi:hypothetical protein
MGTAASPPNSRRSIACSFARLRVACLLLTQPSRLRMFQSVPVCDCLQGGMLKQTIVGVQGPELVQAITSLSDPATAGV